MGVVVSLTLPSLTLRYKRRFWYLKLFILSYKRTFLPVANQHIQNNPLWTSFTQCRENLSIPNYKISSFKRAKNSSEHSYMHKCNIATEWHITRNIHIAASGINTSRRQFSIPTEYMRGNLFEFHSEIVFPFLIQVYLWEYHYLSQFKG